MNTALINPELHIKPLNIGSDDIACLRKMGKIEGDDLHISFRLPSSTATDSMGVALGSLRTYLNVKGINDVNAVMGCLGTSECNAHIVNDDGDITINLVIDTRALSAQKSTQWSVG